MPGPKSYFLDFPNVFVTACGTNFYSQCLPPQTVNLAFSATAMHWLRDKPRNVKGAFHHILVEDPETAEKLKKQAAEDWELLLLHRAKELAQGDLDYHIQQNKRLPILRLSFLILIYARNDQMICQLKVIPFILRARSKTKTNLTSDHEDLAELFLDRTQVTTN